MTISDIINFNRDILARLHHAGIRTSDVAYIDLHNELRALVHSGAKKTYAVAEVARRHGVSVRLVYKIDARFCETLHV